MPSRNNLREQRCWAHPLGDCEGVISQEHYVSECLYPGGEINVRGFPWCKDAFVPLPIRKLTSGILCVKHNNALSELDANANIALNTMRDAMTLFTARDKMRSRRWTVHHFNVNMLLLERWCLKTLINIHFNGKWRFDPESDELGLPPEGLIRVAFGRSRFEGAAGLYFVSKVGAQISMIEGAISIGATTDGNRLVAGRFQLWGLPFVLTLLPTAIHAVDGAALMRHEIKQWFQTHDDKGRKVNSHLVIFTYPSK
ncbi:MAG: hypothetical protein WBX19_15375 [Terracidiphilus sp.]